MTMLKNKHALSRFFLGNPRKRGLVEWIILGATGIIGLKFSWYNYSIFPYSNIFGGILICSAIAFHWYAEKYHKQSHDKTEYIKMIVTEGIYAKIRHPIYLSMIMLNMGISFLFGVLITLIISVCTVLLWICTSYFEESELEKIFKEEYTRYKQTVKWMLIPGIF